MSTSSGPSTGTVPCRWVVLGDGHDEVVPLSVPASTTKLAISDEPEGGSIAPTGPVVASGAIVRPA